jgi:hypothetical protein
VRTPPPSERGRPRQNRSPGTPERDTCRQEAPPRDPLAQLDGRVDLNMDLKVVCPAFGVVPGYNDAVVAACGAAAGPPSGSARRLRLTAGARQAGSSSRPNCSRWPGGSGRRADHVQRRRRQPNRAIRKLSRPRGCPRLWQRPPCCRESPEARRTTRRLLPWSAIPAAHRVGPCTPRDC